MSVIEPLLILAQVYGESPKTTPEVPSPQLRLSVVGCRSTKVWQGCGSAGSRAGGSGQQGLCWGCWCWCHPREAAFPPGSGRKWGLFSLSAGEEELQSVSVIRWDDSQIKASESS